MCVSCFFCSPCRYEISDVQLELQERRVCQERLMNKWEELGRKIRDNIEDLDIVEIKQIANQLNEINLRLLERKEKVKMTFRCTKLTYSLSSVGIITTSAITAALLSVTALTSCAEQGPLEYICISAAALGFIVPWSTFVFQKCHDKIKEEKIYLENFTEQEARDDRLVDRIVSSIHDFQLLHESELESKMDLILLRLSQYGKDLLQNEQTVEKAKLVIKQDFDKNIDMLPSKYRSRKRWKLALSAIQAANRVARKNSRNLDYSSDIKNFAYNHQNLREELLKPHDHHNRSDSYEIDVESLKDNSSKDDYEKNL